ncbi:MAG: hypothetical protein NVS4B7_06540 [Ktedonobacteraceae bacterium]
MLELQEKQLAHYTIQRRLAKGGMSEVYLAYDEQVQRPVAIKVVHCSQDDYFMRFQREVKTLSTLKHEHILPIIEYGKHGAWHYYVMPYIEHGTLRNRIAQGPLSELEAGELLTQIASALQFAHEHGILHRDIKPSNILLKDDHYIYLADFGLAKELEGVGEHTQTGCLIGTPEYMAPELSELPAAPSSDIYAVGILLYQMLTGRVPFKGNTPLSIYWKQLQEQPTPPSALNPAISYAVEQVILRALAKDPARRFKTVRELAQAYAQAMQPAEQTISDGSNKVILASPTQRIISLSPPSTLRVHPAFVVLAAVFLFLVPVTLGISVYNSNFSIQAPLVLGASAQFVTVNHKPHEFSAIHIPTSNIVPISTPYSSSYHGNVNQGNGQGRHGNRRHGHGHGRHRY